MTKFKDIFHESNALADKVWGIIRFWSLFDQTTVGNELTKSLDNISINLSLLIDKNKFNRKLIIKEVYNQITKAAVYIDIARRRKLIANQDYKKIYIKLNEIKKVVNYN